MPKNAEVDAWLAAYDNPMKPVVQRVRRILLAADRRIGECIKWQSPTFTFEGNLATFNPRSKKHASLLFHQGARIPGRHPKLQGGGGTARYMTFASVAEADAAKKDLEAIVEAWCAMRGGGAGAAPKRSASGARASKTTRKKTTRAKASAKKTSKTASKKASAGKATGGGGAKKAARAKTTSTRTKKAARPKTRHRR